jgi:hypothetical protein
MLKLVAIFTTRSPSPGPSSPRLCPHHLRLLIVAPRRALPPLLFVKASVGREACVRLLVLRQTRLCKLCCSGLLVATSTSSSSAAAAPGLPGHVAPGCFTISPARLRRRRRSTTSCIDRQHTGALRLSPLGPTSLAFPPFSQPLLHWHRCTHVHARHAGSPLP